MENGEDAQSLRNTFACDHCRARKVKCDGLSPCSHCKSAGRKCERTPRDRPREKKARVLVSAQYERKIDVIAERISELVALLSKPEPPQASTRFPHEHPVRSVSAPTTPPELSSSHPGAYQSFEGESSLSAHSRSAKLLLQRLLQDELSGNEQTACNASLPALGDLSEQFNSQQFQQNDFGTPTERQARSRTKYSLPQFEAVASFLSSEKRRSSGMTSFWITSIVSADDLRRHCMDLYFSETYTVYDVVIVTGRLLWEFLEESGFSTDPSYAESQANNANLCGLALEQAVSRLPLQMPASLLTLQSLLLGVMYAVGRAKPVLAWTLVCKAAECCQTLGCHQPSKVHEEEPAIARAKVCMFWKVYILDKGLSLRLGRCSNIQECDVNVPVSFELPDVPGRDLYQHYMGLTVQLARLQGKTYEQLYSASALYLDASERSERAAELADEVSRIDSDMATSRQLIVQTMQLGIEEQMFLKSDEVALLSLLALIFRSLPPSPGSKSAFDDRCINVSRQALERHQECIASIPRGDASMFESYVNWVLLYTPFVPFMVIFSHIIETAGTADLEHLGGFVRTLTCGPEAPDDLKRLQSMFETYFNTASRFIELTGTSEGNVRRSDSDNAAKMTAKGTDSSTARDLAPLRYAGNAAVQPAVNVDHVEDIEMSNWLNDSQQMLDQLQEEEWFQFCTNILREG